MTFGHRVENGLHVGPAGLLASGRGLRNLHGDLTAIMRLIDLANLYDAPIAASTWEAIRHEAARLRAEPPSPEACRHFLSLLGHPARLATLLRDMHSAGLLERFIPEFEHARGLLQFNQYHKYTVDEHCLRAVEFATELAADRGPVGRVYRSISQKHLLHLALLIHDLGKGRLEDHREVGLQIAADTAARLGLPPHETESLRFLVHKHMLLNHLAFRRDTADEQLAVQLAVQVGSPELLQMLYVLTAADLGAVGPDVWDGWKTEVVTDLYHRTMQRLAGDSPETTLDDMLVERRAEVRNWLGTRKDEPWFAEHLDALPAAYFSATPPQQAAADLLLLHGLSRSETEGDGGGCREKSLENGESLPDNLLRPPGSGAPDPNKADSPVFVDHGFAAAPRKLGQSPYWWPRTISRRRRWFNAPSPHRKQVVRRHLPPADRRIEQPRPANPLGANPHLARRIGARPVLGPRSRFCGRAAARKGSNRSNGRWSNRIENPSAEPPTFRRIWQTGSHRRVRVPGVPTRVQIDNSTSSGLTIIDVFTHDRPGLLYAVTRTLFELELSVARAKIGTFLDQVVDVFYVTDRQNRKIRDEGRLDEIRRRLVEVVESAGQA